jgi:AcrR family transcriptional regulator
MGAADGPAREQRARRRVLDVAMDLFTRHSYAGTSLQMIADELGVTKGALYHHFHTREELLRAVIDPLINQLRDAIEVAETRRGHAARAEEMLTGYAGLAAANRALVAVLHGDPGVWEVLQLNPEWRALIDRQITLLAGAQAGLGGRVKASIVMSGLAATAAPGVVDADEVHLRRELIEAGRRTLGLRKPRQ